MHQWFEKTICAVAEFFHYDFGISPAAAQKARGIPDMAHAGDDNSKETFLNDV
jgi:hypothetical protein